jgi:hypothetical protein
MKQMILTIMLILGSAQAMEKAQPVAVPPRVQMDLKKKLLVIADLGGISTISGTSAGGWAMTKYLWALGPVNLTNYALGGDNPGKLKEAIFKVLNAVDLKPEQGFLLARDDKGIPMPYILCARQGGRITSDNAKALALAALTKLVKEGDIKSSQEESIKNSFNLMFDPATQVRFIWTVAKGVALMQKLAALRSPNFEFDVLTNWDADSFDLFKPLAPELFDCFDHLFVSGKMGTVKPNAAIYRAVLEERGIPADQCLFFDDIEDNCKAAMALGIDSIHVTSIEQLEDELEQRRILKQ